MVTQLEIIEEIVEEDTLEIHAEETTLEPRKSPTSRPQEPSSSHIVQPPFPERLEMEIKASYITDQEVFNALYAMALQKPW